MVDNIVLPVACKNLSYTVYPTDPRDKQVQIFKYVVPIFIISLSFVNKEINHFVPNSPNNKNIM